MFLVLTCESNNEMSSTVLTVQKACNFLVVEVKVIVAAEAEIVLVVAAVTAVASGVEEEEVVVVVIYAGRTHNI